MNVFQLDDYLKFRAFNWTALLFLLAIHSGATEAKEVHPFSSAPIVVSSSHFGIQEDLPTNCMDMPFIDSKGRLSINACKNISFDLSLDFFRYQIPQSIVYAPKLTVDQGENSLSLVNIFGETKNGFFFGASHDYSLIFMHTLTREDSISWRQQWV